MKSYKAKFRNRWLRKKTPALNEGDIIAFDIGLIFEIPFNSLRVVDPRLETRRPTFVLSSEDGGPVPTICVEHTSPQSSKSRPFHLQYARVYGLFDEVQADWEKAVQREEARVQQVAAQRKAQEKRVSDGLIALGLKGDGVPRVSLDTLERLIEMAQGGSKNT